MIKDDESSVHVDWPGGVQLCHETQHIAIQTIAILLHKLDKVPMYPQK